jgi:hypothetical protein
MSSVPIRDPSGATVSLTVIRQEELEAASEAGGVVPRQIECDGWSATAQWKRGMRLEIGRVIHAISRRSRDLQGLRARIDERRTAANTLKAMPCGFDHAITDARDIAADAMARDRAAMTVAVLVDRAGVIADAAPGWGGVPCENHQNVQPRLAFGLEGAAGLPRISLDGPGRLISKPSWKAAGLMSLPLFRNQ